MEHLHPRLQILNVHVRLNYFFHFNTGIPKISALNVYIYYYRATGLHCWHSTTVSFSWNTHNVFFFFFYMIYFLIGPAYLQTFQPKFKIIEMQNQDFSNAKQRSTLTALFPHQFGIEIVFPEEKIININSTAKLYPVSKAAAVR